MRYIILIFILLLKNISSFAGDFRWQTGDLLFQMGAPSGISDAVAQVTTGKDRDYTHVGIVVVENDSVFVLEAAIPYVCKTPLAVYLSRSAMHDGRPVAAAARLKPPYRHAIPQAITRARQCIGKPYDYVYDAHNDAYYCSELVHVSFLDEAGNPLFKSVNMTFRDPDGNFPAYWIAHFKTHEADIPEGREGTNPGDMSKSERLDFVYFFWKE
ncbi:MAG: hypothetical protein LBT48_05080 [Prevotellaceae bacterium]|jgi:hypothetical protein|nr:hypothetical protein [Prevotellaceae bacterium]